MGASVGGGRWDIVDADAALVGRVRSTLVYSSFRTVESRGHLTDYERLCPPATLAQIRDLVPGAWIPMALAMEHYMTCDALPISRAEQFDFGYEVGQRIQGTLLGTMLRLAKRAGVTPWVVLPEVPRIRSRIFDGADVTLAQVGPKDARLAITALPLARVPFFRNGLRGVLRSAVELFCTKAYVNESDCGANHVAYRVQWV
jgi:hypothetical protein